jgi:hypothetical protein
MRNLDHPFLELIVPTERERRRMGQGSSKEDSPDGAKEEGSSRISRLKQRLHLHRHHHGPSGSSSYQKLLAADGFAGIALLTLIRVCFSIFILFFV